MSKISSLTIVNNNDYLEEYTDEINLKKYSYFCNVSAIRVENIVDYHMLRGICCMPKIKKVSLQISWRTKQFVVALPQIYGSIHIKELEYESVNLKYICEKDLEVYRELKKLKLVIINPLIEFEIYDWSCLPDLEYVEIHVDEIVYWEIIEERLGNWEITFPNIVFDIHSISDTDRY